MNQDALIDAASMEGYMLTGCSQDYDPLIEAIGDSRFVLLGESTHGTHEFYRARAEISARLIAEKGFSAVAVESDWPETYRVNRYIRSMGSDESVVESMQDFLRFPLWMWRNADMLNFLGFLRDTNRIRDPREAVGFYGLDLYGMYSSINAVISYLERVDPQAAELARKRYECFFRYRREEDSYAAAMSYIGEECISEAVLQLVELRERGMEYIKGGGFIAREEQFYAEQNARLTRSAEEYYRSMFLDQTESWNIRERHMADTLEFLSDHLSRFGEGKIIVWAHNAHIGDARATESTDRGELSLGQLMRERYGKNNIFLLGLTTFEGTISAAGGWGGTVGRRNLKQAISKSMEYSFHKSDIGSFYLDLSMLPPALLSEQFLQRNTGVIYNPQSEGLENYHRVTLSGQFDALLHFDKTRALEPIDPGTFWKTGDIPETYNTGL
ncbi:erythromycin esterase-like enzyme [Chitinispirillum alkaliphilum]|nr:erythromycin esterase-like enzyme [Chitinispirillum alkaliphilum]